MRTPHRQAHLMGLIGSGDVLLLGASVLVVLNRESSEYTLDPNDWIKQSTKDVRGVNNKPTPITMVATL